MSFGIAVGDFIAVGKLVGDIVSSLQSVGGARSEYQELIREFESLSAALRHLDRLNYTAATATSVASIKCAALSCRHPLEEFLAKIKNFERGLGTRSTVPKWHSTTSKLKWSFGQKDDIRRLQTYLNVHIGTINILLAEHGFELMNIAEQSSDAHNSQVRDQLDATQSVLVELRQSVSAQGLALRNVQNMLGGLHRLVVGEMKTSWEHFGRIITSVCVSTQQIYTIVLEIRNSLSVIDTRWTHFQAPLVIEDALGYKFPVPSEYDFDMLDAIIRQRFKSGIASKDIVAGNYELCHMKNRSRTISAATRLLPGTSIVMAIILPAPKLENKRCPMPHCGSIEASCFPGGGYTCSNCNVWFHETQKQWNSLENLAEAAERLSAFDRAIPTDHAGNTRKRKRKASDAHKYECLRNVKWFSGDMTLATSKKQSAAAASTPPNVTEDPDISSAKNDRVDIDVAMGYIKRCKARCSSEEYRTLLDTLQRWQREDTPFPDLFRQIRMLFRAHKDLWEGFRLFIPESAVADYDSIEQLGDGDQDWLQDELYSIDDDESRVAYEALEEGFESVDEDSVSPQMSDAIEESEEDWATETRGYGEDSSIDGDSMTGDEAHSEDSND